jgi:hypothetical protein
VTVWSILSWPAGRRGSAARPGSLAAWGKWRRLIPFREEEYYVKGKIGTRLPKDLMGIIIPRTKR